MGHNLDASPLCDAAIDAQLDHDIAVAEKALDHKHPWWRGTPPAVQRVLVNLQFNLGDRFDWPVTLDLIKRGDYRGAAKAIRDNGIYVRQVGPRAERLARLLESVV